MKPAAVLALLVDLAAALYTALLPTLLALWRSPALLLTPAEISHIFMAHVWNFFADIIDQNTQAAKQKLITPNAYGVVLDLGAGHGHTALYLDRKLVTKYVAVEPNTLMHAQLRATAEGAGFSESSGSLLILSCGAEDVLSILAAVPAHSVDTLVSVLALCSIPAPQTTLHALLDNVLAHGGQLLFYEHVLSPRTDVAWWQRFWTPVWRIAFDGCALDRPTHLWIRDAGGWKKGDIWVAEEDEEKLHRYRAGRFVKA